MHVFGRDAATGTWAIAGLFPGVAADDRFGSALAATEDEAVAGAPRVDNSGGDEGQATLFTRGATAWEQHAVLTPAGSVTPGARLGSAVAMDATRILLGAPLGTNFIANEGVVVSVTY